MSPIADSPKDRFRILCVDGGGIRGLVPVLVIAELERRLGKRLGRTVRISDYFHLFAGTSTGGLIALALTAPKGVGSEELASFYTEDGPKIFHRSLLQRVGTVGGYLAPKYTLSPLRKAVELRLGDSNLADAVRDLVVTSYDMTNREPYFFKRWRARESEDRNQAIAEAALATSAAPTYFPSHEVDGRALVDGGVFAANPTIAAIAEALGRSRDEPAGLAPEDLLVVSIGTGRFETGFGQSKVSKWGKLGWVAGGGDEPPVLSAMLGGSSDGADYWAHMLLNHSPDDTPPGSNDVGHGPRYFRLQVPLHESIEMDDASPETLNERLPAAASELIAASGADLDEIVGRLAGLKPLS